MKHVTLNAAGATPASNLPQLIAAASLKQGQSKQFQIGMLISSAVNRCGIIEAGGVMDYCPVTAESSAVNRCGIIEAVTWRGAAGTTAPIFRS